MNLDTYNKVAKLILDTGATKVSTTLPKIDPITQEPHPNYGVWFYDKTNTPRVLLIKDAPYTLTLEQQLKGIINAYSTPA